VPEGVNVASAQHRVMTGRRGSVDDEAATDLDEAVRAACAGDAGAFGTVYRAVQPPLLRYLSNLVGQDAPDVASETWLQATRDLHRFSGDGQAFRGWVVTIGRHRALDHLRAAGRRPSDPFEPGLLPEQGTRDLTWEGAQESSSTGRALALIKRLPPDQAEAVLLRVVVGLDAPTAARVLGKRSGAVRTAASRGLARLEQLLAELPEAPGVTVADPAALKQVR